MTRVAVKPRECPSLKETGKHFYCHPNGVFEPWLCLSCNNWKRDIEADRRDNPTPEEKLLDTLVALFRDWNRDPNALAAHTIRGLAAAGYEITSPVKEEV